MLILVESIGNNLIKWGWFWGTLIPKVQFISPGKEWNKLSTQEKDLIKIAYHDLLVSYSRSKTRPYACKDFGFFLLENRNQLLSKINPSCYSYRGYDKKKDNGYHS